MKIKLIKLITGEVLFGEIEEEGTASIVINNPYSYYMQGDEITLGAYDATLVQGPMTSIRIQNSNILYSTDMSDSNLGHIKDAYEQTFSPIIRPNSKIIL